eukprot:338913-Alexandrium_andersonii.AAC.1
MRLRAVCRSLGSPSRLLRLPASSSILPEWTTMPAATARATSLACRSRLSLRLLAARPRHRRLFSGGGGLATSRL